MDDRKLQILKAIVDSYIHTNQPVGSRTISKAYDLGVSSATIRNEMADLENLGYLNKTHTSSGRIPSDKAFRYFVDEILNGLDFKDVNYNLSKDLIGDYNSQSELYKKTAKLLADTTKLTSYIVTPKKEDKAIKYIQLFSISENVALLLIIGNKGEVEKTLIKTKETVSEETLNKISESLNKQLSGVELSSLDEVKLILRGEMINHEDFIKEVLASCRSFYKKVKSVDVYYDGISNMLIYDEFQDFDKAFEIMKFLDDKDNFLDVILNSIDSDYEIVIGSENPYEIMKQSTLINFSFGSSFGQIGIVGPVRLNYPKLINMISGFAKSLSDIVDDK